MAQIINRSVVIVAILSLALLPACSNITGSPREEANDAITTANESIAEHNRLFEQARNTYGEVKKKVESEEKPEGLEDQIVQAQESLEEARSHLQDARTALSDVQDLDVDPAVKRYARLLSEAMATQLAAEEKEVEFYNLLQKDPTLENNRERALNILDEVGKGYEQAESKYSEARQLANANPDVLGGGPRPGTAERSPRAPEKEN